MTTRRMEGQKAPTPPTSLLMKDQKEAQKVFLLDTPESEKYQDTSGSEVTIVGLLMYVVTHEVEVATVETTSLNALILAVISDNEISK